MPEHIAAVTGRYERRGPGGDPQACCCGTRETGRPEELGASFTLPASIAAGTYLEKTDVVPKALFLCVEDLSGRRYTHATDRWTVRPASTEESRLLELVPGASLVHVIHTAADGDGAILEASESVWPADRIVILDDYDIAQEPEKLQGQSDI